MDEFKADLRDLVEKNDEFKEKIDKKLGVPDKNGKKFGIEEFRENYNKGLQDIIEKYIKDKIEEVEGTNSFVMPATIKEKIDYITKQSERLSIAAKSDMIFELKELGREKKEKENDLIEEIEEIISYQEEVLAENNKILTTYNNQLKKDEQRVKDLESENSGLKIKIQGIEEYINGKLDSSGKIDKSGDSYKNSLNGRIDKMEEDIEKANDGLTNATTPKERENARKHLNDLINAKNSLLNEKINKENLKIELSGKIESNKKEKSNLHIVSRRKDYESKLAIYNDMCKDVDSKKKEIESKFDHYKMRRPKLSKKSTSSRIKNGEIGKNDSNNLNNDLASTISNIANQKASASQQAVSAPPVPVQGNLTSRQYAKILSQNLKDMSIQEFNMFMTGKGYQAVAKSLNELSSKERKLIGIKLKECEKINSKDYEELNLEEYDPKFKSLLFDSNGNPRNISSWSHQELINFNKFMLDFQYGWKDYEPKELEKIEKYVLKRIANSALINEASKSNFRRFKDRIFHIGRNEQEIMLLSSMAKWNNDVNVRKGNEQNLRADLEETLGENINHYRVNGFIGREQVERAQDLATMMREDESR